MKFGEILAVAANQRPGSSVASDPQLANVILLAGFDSGAAVDESPSARTITLTAGSVGTTNPKFGSHALETGNKQIAVPDHDDFTFAAGQPFCMEGWFYATSTARQYLISKGDVTGEWAFLINNDGTGSLQFRVGGTIMAQMTNWRPTASTWYHFAADRDASGNLRLFMDGVKVAEAAWSGATTNGANAPGVGSVSFTTAGSFQGNVDEVRVTRASRYTADFTVPVAKFPRV